MKLREYQKDIFNQVQNLSEDVNPIIQADTGAGKTAIIAALAKEKASSGPVLCVAHRVILVQQISLELAKNGIEHQVLASKHTHRQCILWHRKNIGKELIGNSSVFVGSIDTLLSKIRRGELGLDTNASWTIIIDEGHHCTKKNKWGKLAEHFPNAQIIGATATPTRHDGKSLHKDGQGLFDVLIQAEDLKKNSVKTLIDQGFLSDFEVYAAQDPGDYSDVPMRGSDYDQIKLAAKMKGRLLQLSGDAIKHYKRHANGKQAVAFCASIDFAEEMAAKFRNAGIRSACISSRMSSVETSRIFELFKLKEIQVLTHVDMIGEGVDVPAIEALIMMRPTASLGAYRQWVGRSLRPEQDKKHATILDHVGNVQRHGMPDKHIDWSLNTSGQQQRSNLIPCPKCNYLQLAWNLKCEKCGARIERGHALNPVYCEFIEEKLVLLKRARAKNTRVWETELILPKENDTGALAESVAKVREWFAYQVKDHVNLLRLNIVLNSTLGKKPDFWISNFTIADIGKDNLKKCLAAFKKLDEEHRRIFGDRNN